MASIQDRIRCMNLDHVRPGLPPPKPLKPVAAKPTLPPRLPPRSVSTQDVPSVGATHPTISNEPNHAEGRPAPPFRAEKARLPLPPPRHSRTASNQSVGVTSQSNDASLPRRESSDSLSSTISNRSSISTSSTRTSAASASTSRSPASSTCGNSAYRVPTYDPSSLPPLPPKRNEQIRPPFRHSASSSSIKPATTQPPPLPSRRVDSQQHLPKTPTPQQEQSIQLANANVTPQRTPPDPAFGIPAKRFALSYGLNKPTETPPPIPGRPATPPTVETKPPPIPLATRPTIATLPASRPAPTAAFNTSTKSTAPPEGVCMECRDFSGPDQHAARFPRQSIPSTDVHWLAHQLTAPFESDTKRARAIFTWLHHNVAYDTVAFFGHNVKATTPAATIQSGLAVCSGYAGLFTALASAAGLESVVLSGHGMGFAKSPIGPDQPTPSEDLSGHAWNAVKIDGGEWKLIDPCWGAGHINKEQTYTKKFNTSTFPRKPQQQFRTDGRIMSWDEYIRGGSDGVGEKVTIYTGCRENHGLAENSFMPKKKQIKVRGVPPTQRIQFMFAKVCEHWDNERMGPGKPYVFLLDVGGRDGRERKKLPFRTNGTHWWVDLTVQDLGCSGQTVSIYAVNTVGGQDARGWTIKQYEAAVGRKGMSYNGVAAWQLI